MSIEEKSVPELYKDCIHIGRRTIKNGEVYAYGLHNKLDEKMFNSFKHMEILKSNHVSFPEEIDSYIGCELFSVGNAIIVDIPKCNKCELNLPIDLDYYTNDDTYNLCKLCYDEKIDGQLVITKIDSTLDNLSDWAEVFTFKYKMMEYGGETNHFDTYYCNLNPNSKYYKRFAEVGYISGLGETFDMIDKLTVEEILNGYSELNIF